MEDGIFIDDLKLNVTVKVHVFISDAPARCKACNTIQFNGKFGCIDCMHPTTRPEHTTIYPILPKIELRTNERYLKHVAIANKSNKHIYKGM